MKKINLSFGYGPNQLALLAFIILLAITQSIAYKIFCIEKDNQFNIAKEEATHIKNQLNSAINYSYNATKIVAFLVEKNLYEENFETIAKDLLSENKFIDALQIVEGTKILKTYPTKGNEAAIGFDIKTVKEHLDALENSVKHNKLYFEGPINLVQGGRGILGREPIYKDNKLWGFAVILIRLETLLETIKMDEKGQNKNFTYQIVKNTTKDSEIKTFFNNEIDTKKDIYHKTYLSSGEWFLYVKLNNPLHYKRALEFSLQGLLLCLILTLFIRHLAEQPLVLKKLVAEKTKDLENLNKVLNDRAQELANVNKELEYFAYIISHDLQEPLRMITNFLTQLEKKYDHLLDDKGKKYIFFAVDGAKRMKNIILDILEFSKAGKHSDKPEKIKVSEVIDQIIAYNKATIEAKEIQISFPNLPEIKGYRSPISQIFQNLIGNAIKYSRDNVAPTIEITEFNAGDKMWGFAVKDNGLGIDKSYFEKIFVLFQRVHPTEIQTGSGIGLAIVKKLIENLGGKIWLESEVNQGSIFYFTLPKN